MSEKTWVKLTKNVKYGSRRYQSGDVVEIKQSEYDGFVSDKLIDRDYVPPEPPAPSEPKAVDDMTLPELRKYAADNTIDLGDATKKDDILAAIRAAAPAGE